MDRKISMSKKMMVYFLICTMAMIWPGAMLANRIDPMIFGLPFFFFWYVLWIFIVFIGVCICYVTEDKEADS